MTIKSTVFRGIVATAVGVLGWSACHVLHFALVSGFQWVHPWRFIQGVVWALWHVPAIAAALLVFWWATPKPVPGHCRSCGYDLTGNVSGVCPECGEAA